MRRTPRGAHAYVMIGALVLLGVVLAGCAGSTDSPKRASAGEPEAENGEAVAVVEAIATPGRGRVIADSEGMTLYDSHADDPMLYQFNRPPIPLCYKACARVWRPLLTDAPPQAKDGAQDDLLGTIKRKGGAKQVTYEGHPLYEFVEDRRPGEASGEDALSFGSEWHAMEPDGEERP